MQNPQGKTNKQTEKQTNKQTTKQTTWQTNRQFTQLPKVSSSFFLNRTSEIFLGSNLIQLKPTHFYDRDLIDIN